MNPCRKFYYLGIVIVLISGLSFKTRGENQIIPDELDEKIAHAMSAEKGTSFSEDDLIALRSIEIVHGSLFNHGPIYKDKIISPDGFVVERIYFNYLGNTQNIQRLSLEQNDFWKLVRTIKNYYLEFRKFPSGEINNSQLSLAIDVGEKNKEAVSKGRIKKLD